MAAGQCDRLRDTLRNLATHFAGTECEGIIANAQDRFDSQVAGVGYRDGGTSSTIWGYILASEPGITRITSMGYEDLGPTAIHEEAHHQGVENEELAEAVGTGCGEYAM